tara:strand:- start:519 stop:1040 length:522 start_codon:yes stop_codon:yes gene_type:complete
MNKVFKILFLIIISLPLLSSCGYKKVNQRERATLPDDRRREAVEQGRGVGLGALGKRRGTNYEFSTSNPLWRASLETLDFLPLNTVDYSGGTIISDWYSESSSNNDALKITIRFLSNEIRSDSLKIIVHKKTCKSSSNCKTTLLSPSSKINNELRSVILNKASMLEKESKKKK